MIKRVLRNAPGIVLAACVASACTNAPGIGSPDPAGDDAGGVCLPACRAGYVCLENRCVEACNPPCPAGLTCGAGGACVTPSAGLDAAPTSIEGPRRDAAGAGANVQMTTPGSGVCTADARATRTVPWISQRLRDLPWEGNMCCGPAVVAMTLAAARGAATVTADELRATIDSMGSSLSGWSANGYNCDPNGTNSDEVVETLRLLGNLNARAVRTTWCDLSTRYLDSAHVVIFHGDAQGGNTTQTFARGASHWLILARTANGMAYVNDPGRSEAAQGATRAYTEMSVRARFESPERGGLAVIVDLMPECAPECTGRECGLDARCGVSCGTCATGRQCDTNGRCVAACAPGAACSTGNPCERAETTCEVGGSRCVRTGYSPRGTPCGANMICDGAGQCGPATCPAGRADCDGTGANGCETDTLTSATSCGACGRLCALGSSCSGGVCSPAPECAAGSGRTCVTGRPGVCADGQQACVAGRYGPCQALASPTAERCDTGRDEDCDGMTDEGCCRAVSFGPTLVAPPNNQRFTAGRTVTFTWNAVPGCESRPSNLRVRRCATAGCVDPARDATGAIVLDQTTAPGEFSVSVALSWGPGSYRWVAQQGDPWVAPMYFVLTIDR